MTSIRWKLSSLSHNKKAWRDFPSGPVVKNLPPNAREVGSIRAWEKIPHATEQLNPHFGAHVLQQRPPILQLRPQAAKISNKIL